MRGGRKTRVLVPVTGSPCHMVGGALFKNFFPKSNPLLKLFKEKKREWHLFVSGESIGGGEEQ